MDKVFVFLADGFEEIEGLTVVDLLRRAGIPTQTVSVTGSLRIHGSHDIYVEADRLFDDGLLQEGTVFVLPGGMPGTLKLGEHKGLRELLPAAKQQNKTIAAICAAPSVLGGLGLLEGEEAACHPGFEEKLTGAKVITDREVVVSGRVVTSRGMGTAIAFALELVSEIKGEEEAGKIEEGIVYRRSGT